MLVSIIISKTSTSILNIKSTSNIDGSPLSAIKNFLAIKNVKGILLAIKSDRFILGYILLILKKLVREKSEDARLPGALS